MKLKACPAAILPLHLRSGLGELGYWGSWFLTHWVSLFVSGILCALVGTYPFAHTSVAVMVLFFALFTTSLVCFRCATCYCTRAFGGCAGLRILAVLMEWRGWACHAQLPDFLLRQAMNSLSGHLHLHRYCLSAELLKQQIAVCVQSPSTCLPPSKA